MSPVPATTITVMSVGDLILDEPDPDSFFEPSAALLRSADLTIGHVEVPHTTATESASTDVPAPPSDPVALKALPAAGFSVVTLAGNHMYDLGGPGLLDTVAHCRDAGLTTAGAGATLDAARTPAVVERGGQTIGVLSYNCVGPRESWATSAKPGCAYVHVLTHYELDHASPGGPARVYTFADPDSLERMAQDVARLREQVDVVAVSFHKGVGHTPVTVAMYERPVAHAAIDAGADVVYGHHAHIMRGIETYRGRPIFHGLGNFVTVTHALTPTGQNSVEAQAWSRRREQLYGFAPDPAMPSYPFHPESRNTVVALCRFDADGLVEAGFVPCWIDDDARPVPLTREAGGEEVAAYVQRITSEARLGAELVWRGDEVLISGLGSAAPALPSPRSPDRNSS
jgi:poly-gamma-glutamate capsule biosynthesis protein CapA/YwtB (metallophosphatase superfamily)